MLSSGVNGDNFQPLARKELTLLDLVDRILDKGVVINGDITVSFAGVDILSLKINLVIASLETAKRYGIELPWEKWAREKEEAIEEEGEEEKRKQLAEENSTGDGNSGEKREAETATITGSQNADAKK